MTPSATAQLLDVYLGALSWAFAAHVLAVRERLPNVAETQALVDDALKRVRWVARHVDRRVLFDALTAHGLPLGVAAHAVGATRAEVDGWMKHRRRTWLTH